MALLNVRYAKSSIRSFVTSYEIFDFIGGNKRAIIISDEEPLGVPKRFHIQRRFQRDVTSYCVSSRQNM